MSASPVPIMTPVVKVLNTVCSFLQMTITTVSVVCGGLIGTVCMPPSP